MKTDAEVPSGGDKPAPPSSCEEGEVVEENGRNGNHGGPKEMSVSEYLKCEDMPINGEGDGDYDEQATLQNNRSDERREEVATES